MSSIFENDAAFEPMFDETVAVTAVRSSNTLRGSFAACSFPIEFEDPFGEDKVQSTRQKFSVLIAKTGPNAWNFSEPPRIGDVITLTSGMKTAVTKVSPAVNSWYSLETREV